MANHVECVPGCHGHTCNICGQGYAIHCNCREFEAKVAACFRLGITYSAGRLLDTHELRDTCPRCRESSAKRPASAGDWWNDPGVQGARREL